MYNVAIMVLTNNAIAAFSGNLLYKLHVTIQSIPGGNADKIKNSLCISLL